MFIFNFLLFNWCQLSSPFHLVPIKSHFFLPIHPFIHLYDRFFHGSSETSMFLYSNQSRKCVFFHWLKMLRPPFPFTNRSYQFTDPYNFNLCFFMERVRNGFSNQSKTQMCARTSLFTVLFDYQSVMLYVL
jgi:hypothetical protein